MWEMYATGIEINGNGGNGGISIKGMIDYKNFFFWNNIHQIVHNKDMEQ